MLFDIEGRWDFWDPGFLVESLELSLGLDMGRVFEFEVLPPLLDDYHLGWTIGLTGILAGGLPVRFDWARGPEGDLFYLHLLYPF